MFLKDYASVFDGDHRWKGLDVPEGELFAWNDKSTYVRKQTFFDGMKATPDPVADIHGARVLALLGDSVTTDHISPAGAFKASSPAGKYLTERGVEPKTSTLTVLAEATTRSWCAARSATSVCATSCSPPWARR